MSDPITREEVAEILKEECVLKSVLKEGKECPYFGPSKTCVDCMWGWVAISNRIMKAAEIRRASYEKELAKTKSLTAEVKRLQATVDLIFSLFGQIGDGIAAFSRMIDIAKKQEVEEPKAGAGGHDG